MKIHSKILFAKVEVVSVRTVARYLFHSFIYFFLLRLRKVLIAFQNFENEKKKSINSSVNILNKSTYHIYVF